MSECRRAFDESLLSGYVDRQLTQGDEQRVRLHLEECPACRALVDDLRQLREVTMDTRFETPPDDGWSEAPRGALSRLFAGAGWAVLVAWIVGVTGFAVGQLWSGPESLVEKLIAFGAVSGFALLFLSVLLDRIRTWKTDPYRRVQK